MKIDLIDAKAPDYKQVILNMARLYIYEMSEFRPDWMFPESGWYDYGEEYHLYWRDENRWPFLIKCDGELSGFALVNTLGSAPNVDYNMAEFFVIAKNKGRGIGRIAAHKLFERFSGVWEVAQMPENKAAIEFWDKVIAGYTDRNYEVFEKIIPEPEPHPMRILRFKSGRA